jgi:hypothetical protein
VNDLTSLRELGQAIDTELRGPAPELRQRVLAECGGPPRGRAGRGRAGRGRAGRGRRPRFAPGWRLAVTGGLAVALAVALAAALLAVSTLRLLGAPPGATAQAATILERAAQAAARQPDLLPRPSQFVFFKSVETAAEFSGSSPDFRLYSDLDLSWQSVTGRRAGLLRDQPRSNSNLSRPTGPWTSIVLPGCHPSQPRVQRLRRGHLTRRPGSPVSSGSCAYNVADPVLPTTPGAMVRYLYRTREGENPPPVESYIHAGDLLRQDYLRPAERAALFRALKLIRGVSGVGHAVSLIGQRGIAVQQTYHGLSDQLIFSARTYAFIGEREVVVGPGAGAKVGSVLDSYAVLRIAVVDRVGQRP